MPGSPPSRISESDGITVVADHNSGYNDNHLRPVPSPNSMAKGYARQPPPKGLEVPLEDAASLPFVDERSYLDVKR